MQKTPFSATRLTGGKSNSAVRVKVENQRSQIFLLRTSFALRWPMRVGHRVWTPWFKWQGTTVCIVHIDAMCSHKGVSIDFADNKSLLNLYTVSIGRITTPTAATTHKPIIIRRDGGCAALVRIVTMTAEEFNVVFRIILQSIEELRYRPKVIRWIV